MLKEKVINIPNIITLLRLIATPFFVIALFSDRPVTALILLLFIVAGDGLDGFLARKLNQATKVGRAFDSIVDSVVILVSLVSLFVLNKIYLFWVIILIIPKTINFVVQLIYSKKKHEIVTVTTTFGKISAIVLYMTIILLMLDYRYKIYIIILAAILEYFKGVKHAFKLNRIYRKLFKSKK
jgi:cardiolipin synthase